MEKLEEDILNYGSKNEINKLRELIVKTSEEELENIVKISLSSSVFSRIWDFLLKAFQDSTRCHEKRIQIVKTVLKELEEREGFPSQSSSNLIQRLCMDLTKFKPEHLVDICNFCINSIQSKKISSSLSWKDLLPDTIRILSEQDTVDFNEFEYSGQEFKTVFINSFCMSNWCPEKVTQITDMFSDMPLNKEEHLKVVNKLACYIDKLTPQEVPPFVYHLLRLCKHQNSRVVFLRLQHYFSLRIYNNGHFSKSSSSGESSDFDAIESAEDHEVLNVESTVLFHIQSAASIGHNSIKDYLNALKNTVKSPDFILNPFQLLALLTISTVSQYEEIVFDIIRHSIVRCYNEQQKRESSYWYREIITTSVKPEDVFIQIMNLGERDFLLEAFANFAFALLSVGTAFGRDPIAEKQWTLGTIILLKIIKKKRDVANVILHTFCNHIFTRHSATQYLECLYFLSQTSPLLMLENHGTIAELIESLIRLPRHVAKQLLDALMPLTKVSSTIRDQLILMLRKCLYSRSTETRQVAVHGYVKLISTLKISTGEVLSQNSNLSFSSGFSLYTQISLNRTTQSASTSPFSGEAICWEVLGILKRCFIQQMEVKLELYEALYRAVCVNAELAIPILEILWFHFMEYYVIDEESISPLNCSNLTILRDTNCILQEPLGKFIFTISHIVAKLSLSEVDKDNPTVEKYRDILNSLCRRMASCEPKDFGLDDPTDLTNPISESQQKMDIVKEVMNVFEALIGYKVTILYGDKENQCDIINSLFQGYSRFLHFGKKLKKARRIDNNAQKKSQQDTQAQTSSRQIDGVKGSSKAFQVPDTLLDLATIEKGLKTLLESDVPWTSTDDANTIRNNTNLHIHFLQAATCLISKQPNYKLIDNACQKTNFNHITSIAETLYNRIIKRLEDYIEFDCTAAVSGVECFHAIVLLMNGRFKKNIGDFCSKVGGMDKNESLVENLKPLLEEFENLFEKYEDDNLSDPEVKKLSLAVLNNISALCDLIPSNSNVLSVQVYDWLKQIAYNKVIPSKVAGIFMTLLCETHVRYKSGLILFEHASKSFYNIYGPCLDDESIEETPEPLKIVNVGSANAILQSLCTSIKNILDDVESIIARIKSDYSIMTYSGQETDSKRRDDQKTKEKGVTCQLCFIANVLTNLMSLSLPPGHLSDAIFKNIIQFYSSLSSLTKYFLGRSNKHNNAFQTVWFEKLVKLTGKSLAPAIYQFIYQLEIGQKKEDDPTQVPKKRTGSATMKSKVLKETKSIPKVIYEMEQFGKYIIQISKKTKYDLSRYIGQGTSRDFRIKVNEVQEESNAVNDVSPTQSTEKEAETTNEITVSDDEIGNTDSNDENEDRTSPPLAKRMKR